MLQDCMQGICDLAWLLPEWSTEISYTNRSYTAVGTCDEPRDGHGAVVVQYAFRAHATRPADVNVWYRDGAPPRASSPHASNNVFFSIEAPAYETWQLRLRRTDYDGDMSYLPAASIHRPYFTPQELWALRSNLAFEPHRASVGVWVSAAGVHRLCPGYAGGPLESDAWRPQRQMHAPSPP